MKRPYEIINLILSKSDDVGFIRHVLKNARNDLERSYALAALMKASGKTFELTTKTLREKAS